METFRLWPPAAGSSSSFRRPTPQEGDGDGDCDDGNGNGEGSRKFSIKLSMSEKNVGGGGGNGEETALFAQCCSWHFFPFAPLIVMGIFVRRKLL